VDSLCRAVRDLNMTTGVGASKEAPVIREKKLVNSYVVKSGMLRFNFMLDCCNPGTLPDAHLIAALLDLVSTQHGFTSTTLVVQVEQLVRCVSLCVWRMTFEVNDF